MRQADLITAALFCVLGLVTMLVVVPRYVAGSALAGDLSPAFMPYVAAGLATGAMALLLATRLARRGGGETPPPLPHASWRFIGTAAAVLTVTFIVMALFGYLPGAAAIVAGFMLMARADPKVVAAATIAFPLTLWLLFDRLLGFPLP